MADFTVTSHFDEANRKVNAGLVDGLRDVMEQMLEASNRLVPVDSGDLRDTGRVVVDPHTLEAAVTYGGGDEDVVAVQQHERMDYDHPNGGQPKFLEAAIMSERDKVERVVGAAVQKRT